MKLRNLLLLGAALPLLGACVVAGDPGYGYNEPYYGNAYPSATYIEYNNSSGQRGGYRENYWAHDRAREENYRRNAPVRDDHEERDDHGGANHSHDSRDHYHH